MFIKKFPRNQYSLLRTVMSKVLNTLVNNMLPMHFAWQVLLVVFQLYIFFFICSGYETLSLDQWLYWCCLYSCIHLLLKGYSDSSVSGFSSEFRYHSQVWSSLLCSWSSGLSWLRSFAVKDNVVEDFVVHCWIICCSAVHSTQS